MPRTRVKICGITRAEDILTAAQAGADGVGLVFQRSSKRFVAMEVARRVVPTVPPFVTPVALFVDAPMQRVMQVCQELRICEVQLHGHETPEQVAELRAVRVLKAFAVGPKLVDELALWRKAIKDFKLGNLAGIVLDTASNVPGGSGVANDWAAIKRHQEAGAFAGLPPIVLAGGLEPQTVFEVIKLLRPWAVDVSSGVEEAVGQKSRQKIEAFLAAVRAVDGV